MKRAIWALLIAVPLIALLAWGYQRDPSAVASPLVNHPAPSFTLQTIDHHAFSLARYRGRPILVNFWASWCLGCKVEHPYLVDAWHAYRSRGVVFVGVVYQDTAAAARGFLKKRGGGWPTLLDPGQQIALDYGVYGIPETFFIDRSGVVRYKSTGPVTPELLVQQITRLLHSRSS